MTMKTSSLRRTLYVPLIILAWAAVILTAGWLVEHVVKTFLMLVLSAVVAFALTPLVSILSRWMPRILGIAVGYILGFAVVLGLGALLVITAAAQVTHLVHSLPQYAHQAQNLEPQIVRLLGPFGVTHAKFQHAQQQGIAYAQGVGTTLAKGSLSIVAGIVGGVIDIVLVLILSVYLTANGPKIANWLRKETPGQQRWRADLLIGIFNKVVGGYIRGMLAMSTLIGTLVGVGMWVLHVPYPALLGLLAFFMAFVPVIGTLISGAVCILLALFIGWLTALLVLAYFVIVHIIEGDVVGPRVMGKAVGIHPATGLIGLLIGTELFGVWGALFAAPLAGLLQAFATAAWLEIKGGAPQEVLQAMVEQGREEPRDGSGATPVARPAAP